MEYPKCQWCGNKVLEGAGERAKVMTTREGVMHFHYDPTNGVDCAEAYKNALVVMRQMEEAEAEYEEANQ